MALPYRAQSQAVHLAVTRPVPVLNPLTLDEGLGRNGSSRKVRMADVKAGIENGDSDPAPGEAGGRHLGGLQTPGELLFNKRGNGLGLELSWCGRTGQSVIEMNNRIAIALQVIQREAGGSGCFRAWSGFVSLWNWAARSCS
jgi:hypothetical protein